MACIPPTLEGLVYIYNTYTWASRWASIHMGSIYSNKYASNNIYFVSQKLCIILMKENSLVISNRGSIFLGESIRQCSSAFDFLHTH